MACTKHLDKEDPRARPVGPRAKGAASYKGLPGCPEGCRYVALAYFFFLLVDMALAMPASSA